MQSCCEKSTEKAFSCRIRSLLSAYGPEMSFVGFWVQKIDGENKAMISRLDNSFVLAAQAGADFSELAEFFSLFAGTLLCSKAAAENMMLSVQRTGPILNRFCSGEQKEGQVCREGKPNFQEVYQLLCSCASSEFQVPDWEPFYLDLSHRVRHGQAFVTDIVKEGELVACTIVSAQTETDAVLSAVACNPGFQGKGFGKQVVLRTLDQLKNKTVYVFCATEKMSGFYQLLGWMPSGTWAEIDFEKGDNLDADVSVF